MRHHGLGRQIVEAIGSCGRSGVPQMNLGIRLLLVGACLMPLAGCHRDGPTTTDQLRLITEGDEPPSEKGKQLAPLVQPGMSIDHLREILGEGEMWLSPSLGGGGAVAYYDLGLAVEFADGKVTSASSNHPLLRQHESRPQEPAVPYEEPAR